MTNPAFLTMRKRLWLFPLALTLHNLEEIAICLGMAGDVVLPKLHPFVVNDPNIMCGLLLATIACAWVLTGKAVGEDRSGKDTCLDDPAECGPFTTVTFIAAVVFLGVSIVPHAASSIIAGDYTPGAVTALTTNPIACLLILRGGESDGLLTADI